MNIFSMRRAILHEESASYWITNEKTGRRYYGQTAEAYNRLAVHISQLKRGEHPNKALQADYDALGEGYFTYTVDVLTDKATAEQLEKALIEADPACYNVGLNNPKAHEALKAQEREGYGFAELSRLFGVPRSTLRNYKKREIKKIPELKRI